MVTIDALRLLDKIECILNYDFTVNELVSISSSNHSSVTLTWCSIKNINKLSSIEGTNIIIPSDTDRNLLNHSCNYILNDNPRVLFKNILVKFFNESIVPFIAGSAKIDKSAIIGKDVSIGENVVIEENCHIGNNTIIGHNTVIKRKSIIGNNVVIGSGVIIGGSGFGYEMTEQGYYEKMPHIGNVVIKDNVELGDNNCIDRAVLGSTILQEYVKTDNFVHIAHGCTIGKNTRIAANAMFSGSIVTGENVWIGPSSSISDGILIGDNAFITIGAVVTKNVPPNEKVTGNFAIQHDLFMRNLKSTIA